MKVAAKRFVAVEMEDDEYFLGLKALHAKLNTVRDKNSPEGIRIYEEVRTELRELKRKHYGDPVSL